MTQRAGGHRRFRRGIAAWPGVALLFAVAACSSPDSQVPNPSAPSVPVPTVDLLVDGRVIDEDEQPVPGAIVTVKEIIGQPLGVATPDVHVSADEHGAFQFVVSVPVGIAEVLLGITKNGYEPATIYVGQNPGNRMTLYRTLNMAPGESIQTRIFLNHYSCGWEGIRCRRVVIDAPPGESVDLEVVAAPGQGDTGLVAGEVTLAPSAFQGLVTVTGGEAFIVGGPATVTLIARRSPD